MYSNGDFFSLIIFQSTSFNSLIIDSLFYRLQKNFLFSSLSLRLIMQCRILDAENDRTETHKPWGETVVTARKRMKWVKFEDFVFLDRGAFLSLFTFLKIYFGHWLDFFCVILVVEFLSKIQIFLLVNRFYFSCLLLLLFRLQKKRKKIPEEETKVSRDRERSLPGRSCNHDW